MTETEALERHLRTDLATLGDRFVDEELCGDLYRALAGNALLPEGDGRRGRLALSWRRAEDLVNGLRERAGRERLSLARTGGEGEVSDTVAGELRRLGWALRQRPTSRHDDDHLASDPDPPPGEQGQRRAPVGPEERARPAS